MLTYFDSCIVIYLVETALPWFTRIQSAMNAIPRPQVCITDLVRLECRTGPLKRGDTRLLADFHVVLARLLGNEVLAGLVQDLVSRSSLIALMYQSAHSAEHSAEEHVAIVEALERRDARAAVKLMEEHLKNVEHNLRLHPRIPDLASALRADDS